MSRKRLLSVCIPLAFLALSCIFQAGGQGGAYIDLQVRPRQLDSLRAFDSVAVEVVDGKNVERIYGGRLRDSSDWDRLPTNLYHGGVAVIRIEGFLGDSLVYVQERHVRDGGRTDSIATILAPGQGRGQDSTPVDHKPRLATVANPHGDIGSQITFTLSALDPDGTTPVLACADLPDGAAFRPPTFTWTPSAGQDSTYRLTCTATNGAFADTEYILVSVGKANQPPAFVGLRDTTIDEGQAFTAILTATDPEGAVPTFAATGLPAGATLDSLRPGRGRATFAWKPDYAQGRAQPYAIGLSAGDGNIVATVTWRITVRDVDRKPVFEALPTRTVKEGGTLAFAVTATDSDGTAPAVSILSQDLPGNAPTLSGGLFSWTAGYGQAGAYHVTFKATDGQLSDTAVVAVTVTKVNRPPSLVPIPALSVAEGSTLAFTVNASDPDGTVPVLSIWSQNLPGKAPAFANGNFSWAADYGMAGAYHITFQASDGELGDTERVAVTVLKTDRPPRFDQDSSRLSDSVQVHHDYAATLTAKDPDGDKLTFSLLSGPAGMTCSPDGKIAWKADRAKFLAGQRVWARAVVDDGSLRDTVGWSLRLTPHVWKRITSFASITNYGNWDYSFCAADSNTVFISLAQDSEHTELRKMTDSANWDPISSLTAGIHGMYSYDGKIYGWSGLSGDFWIGEFGGENLLKASNLFARQYMGPVGPACVGKNGMPMILLYNEGASISGIHEDTLVEFDENPSIITRMPNSLPNVGRLAYCSGAKFVLSDSGLFAKPAGAKGWTLKYKVAGMRMLATDNQDPNTVYIGNNTVLYKSVNALSGNPAFARMDNAPTGLYDCKMLSDSVGWALDLNGKIHFTNSGWYSQPARDSLPPVALPNAPINGIFVSEDRKAIFAIGNREFALYRY